MKIEKKKVVKSSKLSHFTKTTVAAALGIAASFGTTACDDSMSATSGDHPKQPETNPTCGQAACGEQYSSSSYTDISSSGEHLSSEAIEALSSAMQPLSSSSMVYPPPESGSPMASRHSSAIRRIFLKRNAVKQFHCRARTSRWRPHYYRKQLERKYA